MTLALRRRAMKPPSGALVSDDFSEADGTLLAGKATDTPGVSWTVANGSFAITGGKVHGTGGATGEKVAWVPAGQVIGSVEVAMTASASKDDGVVIRHNGVAAADSTAFYLWRIGGTAAEMYRRSGGAWTALGSWAFTPATGTTYVLRLSAVGTTIKGYVDGIERVSVTDSTLPDSDTRAGLRMIHDDALADDFKVLA